MTTQLETGRRQPTGQRRGTKAAFYSRTTSTVRGAAWRSRLASVLDDHELRQSLVANLRVQVRLAARTKEVTLEQLAELDLVALHEIRRPAGHTRRPSPAGLYTVMSDGVAPFHVWHESRLELAHLRELDWAPDVDVFVTQVLGLEWESDGFVMFHIPDCLASRPACRPLLLDCRPNSLRDVKFVAAAALTAATADALGWDYEVWDSPPPQRVRNLKHLELFRDAPADVQSSAVVLAAHAGSDYATVNGFLTAAAQHGVHPSSALYHALWRRLIFVDMDAPVASWSPVLAADPSPNTWRNKVQQC